MKYFELLIQSVRSMVNHYYIKRIARPCFNHDLEEVKVTVDGPLLKIIFHKYWHFDVRFSKKIM